MLFAQKRTVYVEKKNLFPDKRFRYLVLYFPCYIMHLDFKDREIEKTYEEIERDDGWLSGGVCSFLEYVYCCLKVALYCHRRSKLAHK